MDELDVLHVRLEGEGHGWPESIPIILLILPGLPCRFRFSPRQEHSYVNVSNCGLLHMNISRVMTLTKKRIMGVIANPRTSFFVGVALLRGCFYIVKYNLFYKNVKIKFPFRAYAPVKIMGKGSVFIDKGCSVYLNVFQGLTIVTLSRDAEVVIGQGCALGGVTIRCHNRIIIGDRTMTAYSLVQDTFIVNPDKVKSYNINKVLGKESIDIGENVWLGGQCIILGGCTVGRDSVLSLGSLCYHIKVGDYCFANYSPARRALPIDKLLNLKG